MRNKSRVVLAEDDRLLASSLAGFLTTGCGFEVAVTHRKAEVLDLLEQTQAAWLILDLELEDGMSNDLVPEIRWRCGEALFLIVLTGFFHIYPESQLFPAGVDELLRKPYRPEDVYLRMQRLDGGGRALPGDSGRVLRIDGTQVNLHNGRVIAPDEQGLLPDTCLRLLQCLAEREGEGWQMVPQVDLLVRLWGQSITDAPSVYGERLRSLVHRVRLLVHPQLIETYRGRNNSSLYALSPQVTLEEAGRS